MGLAATEIGLELHNRVAALASETLQSVHQQVGEALGQVGAAEELDRVTILVATLAQVHLPEIGGELGLLVAPARDVPVGCDYLAPGLERTGDTALDRGPSRLAPLVAHLLVEA